MPKKGARKSFFRYFQLKGVVFDMNNIIGGRDGILLDMPYGANVRYEYRCRLVGGRRIYDSVPRHKVIYVPKHLTPHYPEGVTIILPFQNFSPGSLILKNLPAVQLSDMQLTADKYLTDLKILSEQQKLNDPSKVMEFLQEMSEALYKARFPKAELPLQPAVVPEAVSKEVAKE